MILSGKKGHYISVKSKRAFKKWKLQLKKQAGFLQNPIIMAYRGYGTESFYRIQGHVIEDRQIEPAAPEDSIWANAKSTIKRFLTDTFPEFYVNIFVGNNQYKVCTDANGYFEAYIPNLQIKPGWHAFTVAADDNRLQGHTTPSIQSQLLIASEAEYGIVSDIDDTFLVSHSTRQLQKIRLMMFQNAYTRKQFDGVTRFYNALYTEPKNGFHRPIFFCVEQRMEPL